MDIGSAVGRKEGRTERQLMELADFEHSDAFNDLDALRPHFTPQQLVELTSAVAWENYRAPFNRAFAVEAEGFEVGTVCALRARVGA
jgi:hypothetical protein